MKQQLSQHHSDAKWRWREGIKRKHSYAECEDNLNELDQPKRCKLGVNWLLSECKCRGNLAPNLRAVEPNTEWAAESGTVSVWANTASCHQGEAGREQVSDCTKRETGQRSTEEINTVQDYQRYVSRYQVLRTCTGKGEIVTKIQHRSRKSFQFTGTRFGRTWSRDLIKAIMFFSNS